MGMTDVKLALLRDRINNARTIAEAAGANHDHTEFLFTRIRALLDDAAEVIEDLAKEIDDGK